MKKWIIPIICLIPIVAYVALYAYIETPLYKTSSFLVEASTRDGGLQDGYAYSAFRMPNRTYIHIPSATNSLYRWFAIDWKYSIAAVPGHPYSRLPGLLTVNKGAGVGIDLLFSGKLEDYWTVHTNQNSIAFSNAWLSVTVTKK